jgi:tricorn protease
MKNFPLFKTVLFIAVLFWAFPSSGINTHDTRMMQQPALSADNIAFIYANDLWVADIAGQNPRRLTADEGVESLPCFSPDGKIIAFSAEYDGNTDVFTIPVEGGIPTRLTWHPSADLARGFIPDGKAVLFASSREDFSNRYTQLFTVPVSGGFPQKLALPSAWKASWSPDGKSLAYTPLSPRYQQWKNYRGGTVSTIRMLSLADLSVVNLPQPAGRCNDADPMWAGNRIYFLSDRNGEFNLFSFDPNSKEIRSLTNFKDFPVLNGSMGSGKIILEQAGFLHLFDINSGQIRKLTLSFAADLLELRPRYVKGNRYIRSATVSPSGARAAFGFRGEIITLPAEKGDPRNITETPGAHEKSPAWSPDGKTIAYFSDETGEVQLFIRSQDGKGEIKKYSLPGTGFYAFPEWSPDSKTIVFTDNGRNLYQFTTGSGKCRKIDSDEIYTPGEFRKMTGSWSSDSRWLAYTKVTETQYKRIYIYSVEEANSYPVTDGLSDVSDPVFDPEGKYLFFLASTDAGPVINWFDQSNADMRMSSSMYLATLRKDIANPFAKQSDEEKGTEKESGLEKDKNNIKDKAEAKEEDKDSAKDKDKTSEKSDNEGKNISIDFEGMDTRIVHIPLKAGDYSQLGSPKAGDILYVSRSAEPPQVSKLFRYDLKERKESEVMELDEYQLTHDGKKMLYNKGETWGISEAGKKPEAGKGLVITSAMDVKIDPTAEWKQIFDEAWRINRDYFYDPGMHGTNWKAIKLKYEGFLRDITCRNDLNRLIQWMCSELSVGHSYSGGGDQLMNPERVSGGLLGADYEISDNRYRFKKIYGGLNWNPGLRAPLMDPGINAKKGDYILAVNGKNLTASTNLYSMFENTTGKIVELTIGPNPDTTRSRTVKVEPISSESSLRNRDWVEGNLKKVELATNGRVAYVYVPNTAAMGYEYFKRYFYPQAGKEAIIVDERFNGGGSIADYYIDLLTKPYQSSWHMRYGKDFKTPSASIQGPKVMIIDETAGSGGDMLPWMFRKFKVGTLVGKRTWGGLVGILGYPVLMDGGFVTAPNVAIWTNDGYIVENEGVPPDIEVEMTPAEVAAGKDPQLEKAIEIILEQLQKNPPAKFVRPPFPVKVK